MSQIYLDQTGLVCQASDHCILNIHTNCFPGRRSERSDPRVRKGRRGMTRMTLRKMRHQLMKLVGDRGSRWPSAGGVDFESWGQSLAQGTEKCRSVGQNQQNLILTDKIFYSVRQKLPNYKNV